MEAENRERRVNLTWRETDSLVKPDLLDRADEDYGPPNPGMRVC